jgi:hypothetical protein
METQAQVKVYRHAFDGGDKLKCANLSSTATLMSLFMADIIAPDNKTNPRHISLDDLRDCPSELIDGRSSPRMLLIYWNGTFKYLERPLTDKEEEVREKAYIEVDFERVRRELAPGAPSRLSTLFLADDNDDAGIMLGNMFRPYFKDPLIKRVLISNRLELFQADSRWFDHYAETKDKTAIEHYWNGIRFDDDYESWEYLLEGSITLIDPKDYEEVRQHTFNKWPDLKFSITRFEEELRTSAKEDI